MPLRPGSIIGGKYQLDRPLSRGGMGSVWRAQHVQLGSRVAIKFMDPSYAKTPSFRSRFEREAKAAATLRSPHVVQVHDFGIDNEAPYLVMELLEGEDLHTRLQRFGRLSLQDTARILAQAGKALRRAHEAGLVHRDLKPRNIFLARIDDEEVVKILDFGIAKDTSTPIIGDATKTGELMGSPHYMSPEQLRSDRDLDGRSDVWSMGVIAFRCVTGQLPFPGDVLGNVMAQILVDPVPRASQIAPDLSPAIDEFFARALMRNRDQRFSNIQEMVEAFASLAGSNLVDIANSGVFQGLISVPPPPPRVPFGSVPFTVGDAPAPTSAPASGAPISGSTPASMPQPHFAPFVSTPGLAISSPSPPAPAGTLTTATMIEPVAARARKVRLALVAGIVTFVLFSTGGVITVLRLTGTQDKPTEVVQPLPAEQSAAPAVETASAAVDVIEPAPSASPPAPTESAPSANPTTTASVTTEQAIVSPAKPPKGSSSTKPTASTSASSEVQKPAWGF